MYYYLLVYENVEKNITHPSIKSHQTNICYQTIFKTYHSVYIWFPFLTSLQTCQKQRFKHNPRSHQSISFYQNISKTSCLTYIFYHLTIVRLKQHEILNNSRSEQRILGLLSIIGTYSDKRYCWKMFYPSAFKTSYSVFMFN